MKILFIANLPSPYNVEYLNELGKLANVTAIFERNGASDRDKSWKNLNVKHFKYHILKSVNCGAETAISLEVKKYIKEFKNEKIIIGNPTTPTGIIAILYCKKRKIPYILQSEGGFQGTGRGLKERFKKFLMKDACLYLSGMNIEKEYFLMYGATPEKISNYPFTSLYASDIRKEIASESEKNEYRLKFGMKEDFIIISVGQFIHRKGFDILLRASKGLPKNVGVYIVGGNPTKEYIELKNSLDLQNVYFVGFKDKETLKNYYKASDIFVLPTREDTWGLVINEAMAAGLPVVTTERCIAGISLIKDEENGFVVPVEDLLMLQEKIKILIEDKELREKMAKNNLKKISRYCYEEMAKTIYQELAKI